MLKKSLALASAIILGSFGAANAAGSAETQFVKTELSCLSGTTCAARVQLPANSLISLKGISCVNASENVTSTDLRIAKDSIIYFETRLFEFDTKITHGPAAAEALWWSHNFAINTKAREVWLNLNSITAGQLAATCYAAFQATLRVHCQELRGAALHIPRPVCCGRHDTSASTMPAVS